MITLFRKVVWTWKTSLDDQITSRKHTIYAERQHDHINDESLRSLVAELDLTEISLRKRLDVARRAAAKQAAKLESRG